MLVVCEPPLAHEGGRASTSHEPPGWKGPRTHANALCGGSGASHLRWWRLLQILRRVLRLVGGGRRRAQRVRAPFPQEVGQRAQRAQGEAAGGEEALQRNHAAQPRVLVHLLLLRRRRVSRLPRDLPHEGGALLAAAVAADGDDDARRGEEQHEDDQDDDETADRQAEDALQRGVERVAVDPAGLVGLA
eukprot:CAMPEP_0182826022 /NCGR_PEP_ID=MMETSP0006_2-20121128/16154_1 /TAXON_ID=97485 /ORGANISM="Prymnesium parvum, Strain Texoma1" /LENGTH=188 /DNA_ID=CAMNT_0024953163 /DNA_START=168 /DNA_END=730 /DNA_ORIENTATION=+